MTREEDIPTDPAPAMESGAEDILRALQAMQYHLTSRLGDIEGKLDNAAQAIVQLQNRVLELHASASKDVAAVRSRLAVAEHRLGLTPAPRTNGNGAAE